MSSSYLSPAFIKHPNATLDYVIDWENWLEEDETILSAVWIVPTGITKSLDSIVGSKTTVWLSGGILDNAYLVSCRITTSKGRIDERTVKILIKVR